MISRTRTPSFILDTETTGPTDAAVRALILPGFLDHIHYRYAKNLTEKLRGKGIECLAFHPPGSWGSSPEAEYSVSNYIQATKELLALEPDRPTVLVGHCCGGTVAPHAALGSDNVVGIVSMFFDSKPRFINGTVAIGTDSYPHWALNGTESFSRPDPDNNYSQKIFELPYTFMIDALDHDALDPLRQLEIPTLFIAGRYDGTNPLPRIQEAYDAAIEPKQLIVVESDHDFWKKESATTTVNAAVSKFIEARATSGHDFS